MAEDFTERRIGRRTHSRLRVLVPARLISVLNTQHVQIQNLSRDGVKLRWGDPVRPGSDVVLAWAHHELFGKVVWAGPHSGGILFDGALSEAAVLAMRGRDEVRQPEERGDATAWYLENLRYANGRRRA
jgi:hypothetical protein